jgi:hypothetical protein
MFRKRYCEAVGLETHLSSHAPRRDRMEES